MLPGGGEAGQRPLAPLGPQVASGVLGVVVRDDGRVGHLLEGVLAGLAAFELHQIENLVLAVEQEVMEADEDLGPLGEAAVGPRLLRLARLGYGLAHVRRRAAGDLADELAGGRRLDDERRERRLQMIEARGEMGDPLAAEPGAQGLGGNRIQNFYA